MDPLSWGSVISSLGGGILNGLSTVWANQQNMDLQKEQWAREDTAVQRRVKDLEAAGLNPVLAASGQGSPTSITAHIGAPDFGSGVSETMSNLMSARLAKQQIARSEWDTDISRLDAQLKSIELANEKYVQPKLMGLRDTQVQSQAQTMVAEAARAMELAKKTEVERKQAEWDYKLSTEFGEAGLLLKAIGGVTGIGGAIRALLHAK